MRRPSTLKRFRSYSEKTFGPDLQCNVRGLTPDAAVVRIPYRHDGDSYSMTRGDVKALVLEILTGVVAAVGATMPPLPEDTRPIGALPNFDSILAEDTTVEIFTRLGLEADLDVNPFIKGNRAATFAEVVDQLHVLVGGGET